MNRITPEAAGALIDYTGGGKGIAVDAALAESQLRGAVAIHNILLEHDVAYLADEVGMGKTYVALGAINLLRFQKPDLRVLILAPRENIQRKWRKEVGNFIRNNWREPDLRVKGIQGEPIVPLVHCDRLSSWLDASAVNPERDMFLRMTSFSLALGKDPSKEDARQTKELLERFTQSYWDPGTGFSEKLKAIAVAVNELLPHYDLIVIDEAHNLKHGFDPELKGSIRNAMIAGCFGKFTEEMLPTYRGRRPEHYGNRCGKLLLLSATPLETDYREVWNQLDLFGKGEKFNDLGNPEIDDATKKRLLGSIMVRRVTELMVNGEEHTRNMYRREWRGGGCATHDTPLDVPGEKERLIVALVQKKVSEVINDASCGASFQVGMLSSFESFAQTASTSDAARKAREEKKPAPVTPGTASGEGQFDGDQKATKAEQLGVDSNAVARLASRYARDFGHPLPHPKMDALVAELAEAMERGEKTLVFVRRIRSVDELRDKLNRAYDALLRRRLLDGTKRSDAPELPSELRGPLLSESVRTEIEEQWRKYEEERRGTDRRGAIVNEDQAAEGVDSDPDPEDLPREADTGGLATFFAWYFRGERRGEEHGADFRNNQLGGLNSPFSTLLGENYVRRVLGLFDGEVMPALLEHLGRAGSDPEATLEEIRRRAASILGGGGESRISRLRAFRAIQRAVLAMLEEQGGDIGRHAAAIIDVVFAGSAPSVQGKGEGNFTQDITALLDTRTLFTELRLRPKLRGLLWPAAVTPMQPGNEREIVRDEERRRELLASVIRLGHSYIDLWALFRSEKEIDAETLAVRFLDRLELQRQHPSYVGAWHELSRVAEAAPLIFATNFAPYLDEPIPTLARHFGTILGSQEPVAGIYGSVTMRSVQQFRMPGYPFVLITTDVLQEGEDLHTFCSRVVHYGISWTPSSMEQRTGRVDRVASLTHRRIGGRSDVAGTDFLQVYYPYLADTVEVLQVRRVFEKMNSFIRKLHEFGGERTDDSKVNTRVEYTRQGGPVPQVAERLKSAFDVREEDLRGGALDVAAPRRAAEEAIAHFGELVASIDEEFAITWHSPREVGITEVSGTAYKVDGDLQRGAVGDTNGLRQLPFRLRLRSYAGRLFLNVASPLPREIETDDLCELLIQRSPLRTSPYRISGIPQGSSGDYLLSVEGDILFGTTTTSLTEVIDLLRGVLLAADSLEEEYSVKEASVEDLADAAETEVQHEKG